MDKVTIRINRKAKGKTCIQGDLGIYRPFGSTSIAHLCYTLELPWKQNANKVSCIPAGRYPAFVRTDGKNGWCVELGHTGNRTHVQIHKGNSAADIEGCILVGLSMKPEWVGSSALALDKLKREIFLSGPNPDIQVEIYESFPMTVDVIDLMSRA